jgi:hypothetical protein
MREQAIFEIVNQLNRGAALITSREEREQIAELNLMAGKRARASSAYASALNYLSAGANLLADDRWERRHDLTFALEWHRAECGFLTGEMAAASERLTTLLFRATDTLERATIACLHMNLFTILNQSDRAVTVCLDYLRHLGVEWSPLLRPQSFWFPYFARRQRAWNRPDSLWDHIYIQSVHRHGAPTRRTQPVRNVKHCKGDNRKGHGRACPCLRDDVCCFNLDHVFPGTHILASKSFDSLIRFRCFPVASFISSRDKCRAVGRDPAALPTRRPHAVARWAASPAGAAGGDRWVPAGVHCRHVGPAPCLW